MILVQGKDIFQEELGVADLLLFTANSMVKRDDRLVMGAGIARQVRDMFPGIDLDLGRQLLDKKRYARYFGILVSSVTYRHPETGKQTHVGAFQTKVDWREPSPLDLIDFSTQALLQSVEAWKAASLYFRIALNFPGINHGRLDRAQVLPLIERLPDCVYVYEKGA